MTSRISAGSFVVPKFAGFGTGETVLFSCRVYIFFMYASSPRASLAALLTYTSSLSDRLRLLLPEALESVPEAGWMLKSAHSSISAASRPKSSVMIPARGASFRFSGAGAGITGARIGIGFLTGRAAAVRSRLRQR